MIFFLVITHCKSKGPVYEHPRMSAATRVFHIDGISLRMSEQLVVSSYDKSGYICVYVFVLFHRPPQ